MIRSFKNRDTQHVWMGVWKDFMPEEVQNEGRKKMDLLDSISNLDELTLIADETVEHVDVGKANYYSIKISDRWRLLFSWDGVNARNVQMVRKY